MELLTLLDVLKLGTQTRYDLAVAGILRALGDDQSMGIALLQKVLRLVDLIGGVDGDQYRAELDSRPESDVPLRHVGSPYRDMGARLDAQ